MFTQLNAPAGDRSRSQLTFRGSASAARPSPLGAGGVPLSIQLLVDLFFRIPKA